MRIYPIALLAAALALPLAAGTAYAETDSSAPSTTETSETASFSLSNLFTLPNSDTGPSTYTLAPFKFLARHGLFADDIRQERDAETARIETLKKDIERFKKLEQSRNFVDTTGFDRIYLAASERYGVPPEILSAVHLTETHRSGDTSISSYAGAQGPMQFMPPTWRAYGVDGDGNGTANIHDVDDAIFGAAHYLAANGAARGDVRNALYHYNHSQAYVNLVLARARAIGYQQ